MLSIDELVKWVLNEPENEGITFSGGEPFWQATALTEVARQLKAHGLNVMSFSGFTLEELQKKSAPPGSRGIARPARYFNRWALCRIFSDS